VALHHCTEQRDLHDHLVPAFVSVQFGGGCVFREVNGLWGLIVLVADIWAIVNILQSGVSTGKKVLWTLLVILLPVLGFIIWFFAGPKTRK
jgi:Phospholipase_D-nuclease N-terminal